MKQGALFFDATADRYDIRFDLADYYGGLHCGETFDVMVGGRWRPTRIEMAENWYLVGIHADDLSGLRVRDGAAGEERELYVDALFVAVGQAPRNRARTDLLLLDEGGYVMAGEDCKASLPGVFAAGDCRGKAVRQLTSAVGDGAVAGLAACRCVDERQS